MQRLYLMAKEAGLNTQVDIANFLGLKNSQVIKNWETRGISKDGQITVAQKFRCSVDYIADGVGEAGENASPYIVSNLKSGYTRFGLLDVEAAAGAGIVNSEWPEIVQQIDVSTEWASRTFGKNFSKIRVITARGDSMKGTVEDGDVLFVDSTIREYQRDGIYILAVGNNLKVKRLQQRTDGSFAVISDNKNYDTEIIDRETGESLTICGLVVAAIALKKLL